MFSYLERSVSWELLAWGKQQSKAPAGSGSVPSPTSTVPGQPCRL